MAGDVADRIRRGKVARRERRSGDARREFSEALAIARRSGSRRELVEALKGLGQIERDLGHGEAARPLYEEAVALCREEENPLALAHTIRHLGDVHRAAGRRDLAEPCCLEALALYRGSPRTAQLDLANAIRPLAILRSESGQIEEAQRLWEEARDLYRAVGVHEGVAESSARLARLEG
jgi:tetratricopeptide (TPR) repeat protein